MTARPIGQTPQLALVGDLRRDDETGAAVAAWFEARGALRDWRRKAGKAKGGERAQRLLDAVAAWVGEEPVPDVAPEPVQQTGQTPTPSGGFGPDALPALPPPGKKRDKAVNALATRVRDGRFDEESVARALQWLEAADAKPGTIAMVRRAYGLEG